MFASLPETTFGSVRGAPGVGLAFDGSSVGIFAIRGHAGSGMVDFVEDLFGRDFDVPFAAHPGAVSGIGEDLGPCEARLGDFFLEFGVVFLTPPNLATGGEHGATGDADRTMVSAGIEGLIEAGAHRNEAVEVWSVDVFAGKSRDRFPWHVVGDDEKEVGLRRIGEGKVR